jgi:hypothetical protein
MNSAPTKSADSALVAEIVACARDVLNVASQPPSEPAAGRPPVYDVAAMEQVCALICDGKPLADVFGKNGLPSKSTFYRWVAEDEFLQRLHACALHARAEAYADELIEITRDWTRLYITQASDETKDTDKPVLLKLIDKNALGALQMQIDALKWRMAKDNPRKYADLPALAVIEKSPVGQGNGDSARIVGQAGQVIEHDALESSLIAWRNRGAPAPAGK